MQSLKNDLSGERKRDDKSITSGAQARFTLAVQDRGGGKPQCART